MLPKPARAGKGAAEAGRDDRRELHALLAEAVSDEGQIPGTGVVM